jgi:hypothetical protein
MRGTATTEQSSNSRRGPCSGSHLPTFTEALVSLGPVHMGFVVQGWVLHFLLSMLCHQLPYPFIHNMLTVIPSVITYDRYVFVRFGVPKWYCWGFRRGVQCCFTGLMVFMLHRNVVSSSSRAESRNFECLTQQVKALHCFKVPQNGNTASHPRRQL